MKVLIINTILLFAFIRLFSQSFSSSEHDINFTIPTSGKIASMYGWRTQKNKIGIKERKFHKGIDIAGKWGEKIYAAADGKIEFVGRNSGYGLFIEIHHNKRFSSGYGHLKKVFVKKGEFVTQGQIIGEMGNSGTTFSTIGGKGIHLHFEIRDNLKKTWYSPKGAVNPLKYISNSKTYKKYDFVSYQPELKYLVSYPATKIYFNATVSPHYNLNNNNNQVVTKNIKPVLLKSGQAEIIHLAVPINSNMKIRKINYFYTPEKKRNKNNY